MLIPDPWDVSWTHLGDGIFNSPGSSLTDPATAAANPQGVATTLTSVQLSTATPFSGMVLAANANRKLLILQNTSTATSPDVAPALYFNFKQLASVGNGILLPPGVGLALDTSCPIDAVYLTYGAFVNGGNTVAISAIVGEGVTPGGSAGADAATALSNAAALLQQLLEQLQGHA